MIKNVIFDIGKVLLYFDRDFLLGHFYQGDQYELLKDKLFKDWEMLDEDLISLSEYEKKVRAELPQHLRKYASAVLNNWEYCMSYNKGIMDLIFELKEKGYKLFILSNMTFHFIKNQYKFPLFDQFDGIVYSAPLKMVKPNDDIYKYLLNKYNLKGEECLFTDDIEKNLATAARFNIKTFLYKNNTDELRDYILSL